jgi:ATPase subunit of ABC transporter with duplicated ATPase domains
VSKLLINCRDLSYFSSLGASEQSTSESENWDLRQLNWTVETGDRVCFIYEDEEQKQVFWRLLLNKLKPKSGLLEIQSGVLVYSDEMLWTRARRNVGLDANLESKLFEPRPWLNGRMVNVMQLVDRVGLSVGLLKIPLEKLQARDQLKAWLVMMMAAKVKVWLVDTLMKQIHGENLKLLMEWLSGFSGAWVTFKDETQTEEKLIPMMTSSVHLHRNGSLTGPSTPSLTGV